MDRGAGWGEGGEGGGGGNKVVGGGQRGGAPGREGLSSPS